MRRTWTLLTGVVATLIACVGLFLAVAGVVTAQDRGPATADKTNGGLSNPRLGI